MGDHKTFLVRCGEVALKGTNKPYFERLLAERLKFAAKRFPGTEIKREACGESHPNQYTRNSMKTG